MSRLPTTVDETPFFVRAGDEDVFAILTEPTEAPRGIAAIVLTGGAFVGATNRNRVSVRIARDLASRGFHAVRMDYHGVGDSTGDIDTYLLERPFTADLLSVVHHLESRGLDRFVLVGTTCFGARTALAGAAQMDGVLGAALMSIPLRDYPNARNPDETSTRDYVASLFTRRRLQALKDPAKRRQYAAAVRWKVSSLLGRARSISGSGPAAVPDGMSPAYYKPLAQLAGRGVPVLIGYGDEDDFYADFKAARNGPRLSALLDAPTSRIQVKVVEGNLHALRRIASQDMILALTVEWLEELVDPIPAGG
jgi:alpha/beta superfamily hydrolase